MTAPTPIGPRHGRHRLLGPLDEFHHALNALQADTCERGRCDPDSPIQCTKHQRQALRRRQRREGGGS